MSAAIEDQFSSVESCQTLSTVPVAFSFLLRSGNTELLSHQKIQAFPANISPLWLPCCSSQRCCRCNPKRSALLKDPCGSLSEKLKLCWICTACSGWSGGITTDVSEDDNQQQPSETELENPEANESNKFLVVYRWVGIVHEVEGDPHSLRSDCADSVSLRVATHFPPFQWPFPLRSGNTELLSHRKIQAFPAKISPSWLPCCSSQRCCRCNPKRSALLKDSCGLVS